MEGIFAISQYDSGILLKAGSADFADGKGKKKGQNCVAMYVKVSKYCFNVIILQKTVTGKVICTHFPYPELPKYLFIRNSTLSHYLLFQDFWQGTLLHSSLQ